MLDWHIHYVPLPGRVQCLAGQQNARFAFDTLRQKLSTTPVLAYPDFSKDFMLETDASKLRLGAILSQNQEDQKLHPVAYTSRSISNAEANYAITNQ